MTDDTTHHEVSSERPGRTFLCVVDNTDEYAAALQFACQRAKKANGRVALLYVVQPQNSNTGWPLVTVCAKKAVKKRKKP